MNNDRYRRYQTLSSEFANTELYTRMVSMFDKGDDPIYLDEQDYFNYRNLIVQMPVYGDLVASGKEHPLFRGRRVYKK